MTRYGLIGAASLVSLGAHSASQALAQLGDLGRDVLPGLRPPPCRARPSPALSAVRVSRASPIRPCWAATSLFRSIGSRVAWMIVLPVGIPTPKPVSAKLQPMPRMTSASARKRFTGRGFARPPLPERQRVILREGALALDRGGHRDVPGLGQALQLRPGPRVVHALARVDHRVLGRRQHPGGLGHRGRVGAAPGGEARHVDPAVRAPPRSTGRAGTSISTGPGRPLRSWKKARRSTSGAARPMVSGSAHLVMCRMFRVELKFG